MYGTQNGISYTTHIQAAHVCSVLLKQRVSRLPIPFARETPYGFHPMLFVYPLCTSLSTGHSGHIGRALVSRAGDHGFKLN